MSGMFIQGLTDPMAHHANQNSALADTLGGRISQAQGTTMDLFSGGIRGEAGQANVQGGENWRQAAAFKGQNVAQMFADGTGQITNHYGQLGATTVQAVSSISMPTA